MNRKSGKIVNLIGVITILLLVTPFMAQSQSKSTASKIETGDEVPNFTFTKMVNYPTKEVELKDLKDKLVITDGWAIW